MVERLLSPGDVVAYRDDSGIMRNAVVCRVYPEFSKLGGGDAPAPLADLVYVVPPEAPALYPRTVRKSLVHPQGSPSNPDETFYAPVTISV